jgi:hypothetical protein
MSASHLTNGHTPSLTKSEAESLVKRIQSHITDARALVLELYEREGWKALGYDSWRECVVTEFAQSQSRLYQLLDAAQVEKNISTNGGKQIAERVLRPLAKLEPEQQRKAWEAAIESSPKPTAELVARMARRTIEADATSKHSFNYPATLSVEEKEERRKAAVAQQEREIKSRHLFIILGSLALGKQTPADTAADLLDFDEEALQSTGLPLTKAIWEKAIQTLKECAKQWEAR